MDPAFFALLQQLGGGMAGKPGSQLSTADFSRYFSPQFGALTGTSVDRSESDEDIIARTAPYLSQLLSLPEGSEGYDDFSFSIAQKIASGIPAMQIRKELRQSGLSKEEKEDYSDLLDTLSTESIALQKGRVENKNRKTVYSEAGYSEPNTPYDPEPFMGGIMARLAEQYKPYEKPEGYDAGVLAKQKMDKRFDAPYEYGGQAGITDVLREGDKQQKKDFSAKLFGTQLGNPLLQLKALSQISKLQGYGKGLSDLMIGTDYTKIDDRKKAYTIDEIKKSMKVPDDAQAEAIFKKLQGPPIRTELVNEQRAAKAKRIEDIARRVVSERMQKSGAGSPFLDQLQARMIFTKMIENPQAFSNPKNSGA